MVFEVSGKIVMVCPDQYVSLSRLTAINSPNDAEDTGR
jgi:hypothetical protein